MEPLGEYSIFPVTTIVKSRVKCGKFTFRDWNSYLQIVQIFSDIDRSRRAVTVNECLCHISASIKRNWFVNTLWKKFYSESKSQISALSDQPRSTVTIELKLKTENRRRKFQNAFWKVSEPESMQGAGKERFGRSRCSSLCGRCI